MVFQGQHGQGNVKVPHTENCAPGGLVVEGRVKSVVLLHKATLDSEIDRFNEWFSILTIKMREKELTHFS